MSGMLGNCMMFRRRLHVFISEQSNNGDEKYSRKGRQADILSSRGGRGIKMIMFLLKVLL